MMAADFLLGREALVTLRIGNPRVDANVRPGGKLTRQAAIDDAGCKHVVGFAHQRTAGHHHAYAG